MNSVTVPLYIEQDRPFVDLELTGQIGQTRTVRCWLDTGGSLMKIRESVARDLGVFWTPVPDAPQFGVVKIPRASIGGFDLDLSDDLSYVELGAPRDPGIKAEAYLGAQILGRYHVIFDYPRQQFTIAKPGTLTPQGTPVPSPYRAGMYLPRLDAMIDGVRYGLVLHTGASCSMLSNELVAHLYQRHPDWPGINGAAGVANMSGDWDATAPLISVPEMRVGDLRLENVLVVGRNPGDFEEMMTSMMTGQVIGALAGNALKQFRVEIDYANQTTYFERTAGQDPNDVNVVGIVLKAEEDGRYTITGRATSCGYLPEAVQAGDRLVSVDGRPVDGLARAKVLRLLRGFPGDMHTLELERAGKPMEATLPVVKLL